MKKNNDKYKFLAKNTIVFTISSFGSKLLVFLLVPLYTSILSTGEYGVADIITTTSSLLLFVFSLNIQDAVLRFGMDEENKISILEFGLKVFFLGSFVLLVCMLVFYKVRIVQWNNEYYIYLFLIYISTGLNQILGNYLRAVDKISDVAMASVITTFLTVVCNILFLMVLGWGLDGYLLSIFFGNSASCIFSYIKGKISFKNGSFQKCTTQKRKEMLIYTIPLIFNGVAWWANNSIDKYFLIAICGTAENGIYSVAYKIPTMLLVLHTIFFQAWNLSAIREYDKEDSDGFFSNTYEMYNSILVTSCSFLVFANRLLARVMFAKDFFIAWSYSSILLFSIIFSALSGFIGSIFSAIKNSRVTAFSAVSSAIVNCALNAILIPYSGSMGAAIATCVSYILMWLIRLICSKKHIYWHIPFSKHIILYCLLIMQIFIEHLETNYTILQIPLVCIIVVMCKRELCKLYSVAVSNIKLKKS